MHRKFIFSGALLAGLGVAFGAFGAHGLEKLTTDENIIHSFQTGVDYQLYHSLALIVAGILFEKFPNDRIIWAGRLFGIGIALFSGSIYLLALLKIQESSAIGWVGPITPLGGLSFIAGWFFLIGGFWKRGS